MPDQNTASANSSLQLKNILVPTDLSDESLKAVHYGLAFAAKFNAALSLLHVVPPVPIFAGFETVPLLVDDPTFRKNVEEQLAQFVTKHIPTGVAATQLTGFGFPFEEVASIAKNRNIDLIIISTHGHTGIKRVAFGSTAERIVQYAGCPVLVVRKIEREFIGGSESMAFENGIRINRILVPIDFSDCSRKALRYAVGFARQFGSSITCIHVLNVSYGTGEAGIVVELAALQKSFHADVGKKMAAWLAETAGSIKTETIIRTGGPYREIIQAAEERQIDLIVVGTHGRTGVGHFLLGSTAERIVRHAHAPVLVVREKQHEFIGTPPTGTES